mmetsp:Transcript_14452/g.35752  ORF Transcript_14452/g.35752 Transcript_14452/m.35752 type:complete len:286 (-) Transcript_14452:2185-3042(-)
MVVSNAPGTDAPSYQPPSVLLSDENSASPRKLQRSLTKRGLSKRKFVCKFCNKDFPKGTRLRTHLRIHTNEFPFSCASCPRRFKWKSSLTYHQKHQVCFEKKYDQTLTRCLFCDSTFHSEAAYQTHACNHLPQHKMQQTIVAETKRTSTDSHAPANTQENQKPTQVAQELTAAVDMLDIDTFVRGQSCSDPPVPPPLNFVGMESEQDLVVGSSCSLAQPTYPVPSPSMDSFVIPCPTISARAKPTTGVCRPVPVHCSSAQVLPDLASFFAPPSSVGFGPPQWVSQ